MTELKDKLSKYGLVMTCKLVHPDVLTIVMTNAFKNTLTVANEVMDLITKTYPEHTTLETCIMENNLCVIVLKRKTT